MIGELRRIAKIENKSEDEEVEIQNIGFRPDQLAGMLQMIDAGAISGTIAKIVFEEMYRTGADPEKIVQEKGLTQVSDASELERVISQVIAANPAEVAGYRAGKDKLFGFFVGQVMKLSGGKANPGKVNELLKQKLGKG